MAGARRGGSGEHTRRGVGGGVRWAEVCALARGVETGHVTVRAAGTGRDNDHGWRGNGGGGGDTLTGEAAGGCNAK